MNKTLTKIWNDLRTKDFIIFYKKKEIIFSPQLGFRGKYSTAHALINLTDKIKHELDKSNCACGIFVDFQKACDKVDHHILLKKLEYYFVGWNFK